jgi:iron-sulfur cluster repair protein YtfE (RIC family)
MNSVSINQHYTEDHDRLDELFHQFQSLKSSDFAKAIHCFQEFKSGLERHIVWEEEIVFPAFEKRFGQYGGPTEVMRWEHREIRKYLDALLEKLARGDKETEVEEMGLQGVLCPHNQKEENILYPMIDHVTEVEERKGIFAQMGLH